jgi:hypothetical protein
MHTLRCTRGGKRVINALSEMNSIAVSMLLICPPSHRGSDGAIGQNPNIDGRNGMRKQGAMRSDRTAVTVDFTRFNTQLHDGRRLLRKNRIRGRSISRGGFNDLLPDLERRPCP